MGNYIVLLLLLVLPLFYKYSFWLYTIQLKEYRWDRFKEYLSTPQGKKALYNFWFLIELPIFILTFVVLINKPFEIIIYNLFFVFLLLYNIFVFGKMFRKKLILPKITGRLIITSGILGLGVIGDLGYIVILEKYSLLYVYFASLFLFSPYIIFLVILITYPFISFKKNQIIKKASKKSLSITNVIKIGITGSYGKSSVKEFLCSILKSEGKLLQTPDNINTELGVSRIVLNELHEDYDYFVAEMGAYKIGEISTLGNIVNHKYGFLTAIGNQHLGLFGSLANIKKGKSEIAEKVLENNGILYVNWSDKNIQALEFNPELHIVKYGMDSYSNAVSEIKGMNNGMTNFDFFYKDQSYNFNTNLVGTHNIINITGIIAFCLDQGISPIQLQDYLLYIKSPKSTCEIIKNENGIVYIDDTYNLSEDSLLSGLDILYSFENRKILVLDDILELGAQSSAIHYNLGKKIAESGKLFAVMFIGVNYKINFEKGLIDGGFLKEKIVTNLNNIDSDTTILFEGRKAKQFMN